MTRLRLHKDNLEHLLILPPGQAWLRGKSVYLQLRFKSLEIVHAIETADANAKSFKVETQLNHAIVEHLTQACRMQVQGHHLQLLWEDGTYINSMPCQGEGSKGTYYTKRNRKRVASKHPLCTGSGLFSAGSGQHKLNLK